MKTALEELLEKIERRELLVRNIRLALLGPHPDLDRDARDEYLAGLEQRLHEALTPHPAKSRVRPMTINGQLMLVRETITGPCDEEEDDDLPDTGHGGW